MALNGRRLGRGLNAAETGRLRATNPHFWDRELTFKEQSSPRYALAQVYDPAENWSFFNLVQEVIAPKDLAEQIKPMLEKTSARLSTRRNIG